MVLYRHYRRKRSDEWRVNAYLRLNKSIFTYISFFEIHFVTFSSVNVPYLVQCVILALQLKQQVNANCDSRYFSSQTLGILKTLPALPLKV